MSIARNKYDISVIVPTYNRSELLNYSLHSLSLQNLGKNNYEVIVADDGSSDDTLEVVKKYEDRMNLKYVYQEDKGYRPASARNKGIQLAEGNICLLIDSGVILNVNCLSEHIGFHTETGFNAMAIGYVYGFYRTEESDQLLRKLVIPENPAESIRRLTRNSIFFDVREEHYFRYKDQLEELPAPWFYFWTCHVSVITEKILEVGLFDENYDGLWGVEDNDLGYRLHQAGVKTFLLRPAEAIHYPHVKDQSERRKEGYVNCEYFHKKFPTLETAIFLENYMNEAEFVDINKIIVDIRADEKIANVAGESEYVVSNGE